MCFLFIDEECYFVFLYITICLYNPWLMNIGLFSSCGVIIYLKAVIVCVHDRELVSALDFFFLTNGNTFVMLVNLEVGVWGVGLCQDGSDHHRNQECDKKISIFSCPASRDRTTGAK